MTNDLVELLREGPVELTLDPTVIREAEKLIRNTMMGHGIHAAYSIDGDVLTIRPFYCTPEKFLP